LSCQEINTIEAAISTKQLLTRWGLRTLDVVTSDVNLARAGTIFGFLMPDWRLAWCVVAREMVDLNPAPPPPHPSGAGCSAPVRPLLLRSGRSHRHTCGEPIHSDQVDRLAVSGIRCVLSGGRFD
jgi:hypothetical protein